MPVSDVPGLADLLDRADNVAVAIDTKRGPHVTPELFVVHDDRIWCLAAAPTLKARLLAKRPRAGLLVHTGGDAAVLAADVVVIDPGRPLAALSAGTDAVRAPAIVASFLARNHLEMVGAAMDAASMQLGTPPARRVLLGFDPVAHTVLRGPDLVASAGWVPIADDAPSGIDPNTGDEDFDVPLDDLPNDLASLLHADEAVLGWSSGSGPVALPCSWKHEERAAAVPAVLWDAVAPASSGPCSLMVDEWTGLGPTGKRGVMLRGEGTSSADGDAVTVRIAAERAAFWEGIDTGTVS